MFCIGSRFETRADLLRHSIAYALMRVNVQGRKGALTDAHRYAIADHAVAKLREHGDRWRLDEPIPRFFHGPSWIG